MALKIFVWFSNLFHSIFNGDLDDEIKKYTEYAVKAFQALKTGFANPQVHNVIEALPGDWEIPLLDGLQKSNEKVLNELIKGQSCLNLPTFGDKFRCFMEMASVDDETKTKLLNSYVVSLAIELVKEFVTKQFNLNKILMLVPAVFEELFGKKK